MKGTRKLFVAGAALAASLAVAAPAAISAGPGTVVKVSSTISLGATGYQGKVTAKNPNCVAERTVVLKQKGHGVLSRVKSNAKGSWKANLDELNANIKGNPPIKVFAEVKPSTQATAGPIYKCQKATSRTVAILGG